MRAILKELTGTSWDDWWARNVERPADMDFAKLLRPVGLRLVHGDPQMAWAGWTGGDTGGAVRLTTVERGSPAWAAGFTPDDIIVAIDGKRITKQRFDAIANEAKPGTSVTVSYFRRDQLEDHQLARARRFRSGATAESGAACPFIGRPPWKMIAIAAAMNTVE
jgi:predicted metalloprotease with PDZ domain